MTSSNFLSNSAVAVGAIIFLQIIVLLFKKKPKYLPGPPRLPILGNLHQMPETEAWVTYMKWKDIYGDAFFLDAMGSKIVVLNSYQSCLDLLDKRSDIYSDRAQSLVSNKIMGWEHSIITRAYDDQWRRYRRMVAQSMRKDAVKHFHPFQERETARFLGFLLQEPERFMEHFRFTAARSLLMSIYGIEVKTAHDPIITVAEKAMAMAVVGAQPGNFLVDFFPALRYVPEWFPGAGWKTFARVGKELTDEMINTPFQKTISDMDAGRYQPSFTAINLEREEDPFMVKWCSSTLLSAGTDTSVASVRVFILAMVLHPEVQKKLQAELDTVVGTDRLPLMSDRENLPYMNAVMREMIRWQPVSPLAVPHRSIKDDVYQGGFIPAGTIIFPNTWAITRDPNVYDDPDTFNPDRFLPMFDPKVPVGPKGLPLDPLCYGFGYGRRVCAGMHYAEAMVFITMSRLLATFDMTYAKDSNGNDIIPNLKFNSSIVREVDAYPAQLTPRSEAAKALVVEYSNAAADIKLY